MEALLNSGRFRRVSERALCVFGGRSLRSQRLDCEPCCFVLRPAGDASGSRLHLASDHTSREHGAAPCEANLLRRCTGSLNTDWRALLSRPTRVDSEQRLRAVGLAIMRHVVSHARGSRWGRRA